MNLRCRAVKFNHYLIIKFRDLYFFSQEALRLTQKVLSMSGGAGTSGVHSVYELEAVAVEQWVHTLILQTILGNLTL